MKNMLKTLLNGIKFMIPKRLSDLFNDLKLSDFENDIPQTWIITITEDDEGNLKTDKTFEEIKKAVDDGLNVEVEFDGMRFNLKNGYGPDTYDFASVFGDRNFLITLYRDGYVELEVLTFAIQDDLANKMNKVNPSGTGSFSMNRKVNSTVGDNSTAIGEGSVSEHKNQFTEGMFNEYVKSTYDEEISVGDSSSYTTSGAWYYGDSYTFGDDGWYTINQPTETHWWDIPKGKYFGSSSSLGGNSVIYYRTPDSEYVNVTSNYYKYTNVIRHRGKKTPQCKKYAKVIGNGTSDTQRSNAHTLDWQGNAEYAGDVKANACGGEEPISLVETNELAKKQPDWSQVDENAPDFIKNKTHYEYYEWTQYPVDGSAIPLVEGQQAKMYVSAQGGAPYLYTNTANLDGIITVQKDTDGKLCVGTPSVDDWPFCLYEDGTTKSNSGWGRYNVMKYIELYEAKVKTLDSKYVEPEVVIINFNLFTLEVDKTVSEILELYNSGKVCIVKGNRMHYYLTRCNSAQAIFTAVKVYGDGSATTITYSHVTVSASGKVTQVEHSEVLSNLSTTDKTLVGAINELYAEIQTLKGTS